MPRRTLTPATPAPPPLPVVLPNDPAILDSSDPIWADNLRTLRRHWKWAAFSQFFYTFAPLLSMTDVTLVDIEDDLARGLTLYLPRVITRLLYTLTQDRKISIDTWQTALRKQYLRRDPAANPIGPEPMSESREPTRELSEPPVVDIKEESAAPATPAEHPAYDQSAQLQNGESTTESLPAIANLMAQRTDGEGSPEVLKEEDAGQHPSPVDEEESRDWLELPMLEKLDSLHLLIEWQFQNPHRLRQIMKSDDDYASWRIEPIGYDAKTNAYWLIGSDRLWLQRVPPKPPKSLKRKRPTAKKASTQTSSSKSASAVNDDEEYNSEAEQESPKRKRTQPQRAKAKAVALRPKRSTASRLTRTRRGATQPEAEPEPTGGRGSTRAAKMQANKRLDVQAKELAEFKRQAAAFAAANRSSRSTRQSMGRRQIEAEPAGSPATPARSLRKAVVGTRTSARLRSSRNRNAEDAEDEWQQVPEEWLQETVDPQPEPETEPRSRARNGKKGKGKGRATAREVQELEKEEQQQQQQEQAEWPGADADADHSAPMLDGAKTGLESDEWASDLTELSVSEEPEDGAGDTAREQTALSPRPSGRMARARKRARVVDPVAGDPDAEEAEKEGAMSEQQPIEEATTLPEDLVEWEAICVTLHEWEHIAERFEKATHYLEKALYKRLAQNIVPIVTAELREAERKKRLEEAVVHRKRSSRIAIKESEKEQARETAKKKAEEDEKLSRAKRMEMRAKKEEDERKKRDKEREKRRLEREEREERGRQKEERAQRRNKAAEDSRASTSTPAAGTHSTESIVLTSVSTASDTQTPNWVLDCEVCGKRGVNLDDGLPMVCCGMCSKWQHIGCHDIADQQMGRPRRDWKRQQFCCRQCRARASNGGSYITSNHQRYPTPSAHSSHSTWSQAAADPSIHPHKPIPAPQAYSRSQSSDMRSLPQQHHHQHHQVPQSGTDFGHAPFVHQDMPAQGYTRTQNGLTFSHYQPENRAFMSIRGSHANTHQSTPSPPIPAGHAWSNGYSSAQPVQPYGHGGAHSGGMGATSYQAAATSMPSQHQPYGHGQSSATPAASTQWGGGGASNGYLPTHDSAVRSAAESLAFMQGGGAQQNGWHHTPGVPHGNRNMYGSAAAYGRGSVDGTNSDR